MSALSEVDIKIHENGEVSSDDEADDAFDEKIPVPVAPCPYVDYVPRKMDKKSSKAELKSKEAKDAGSSAADKEAGPVDKSSSSDVGVVSEKASEKASEKVSRMSPPLRGRWMRRERRRLKRSRMGRRLTQERRKRNQWKVLKSCSVCVGWGVLIGRMH